MWDIQVPPTTNNNNNNMRDSAALTEIELRENNEPSQQALTIEDEEDADVTDQLLETRTETVILTRTEDNLNDEQIPWKQLSIVFSIFIIDIFSFTTLAPYLGALVRDLNLVPGDDTKKIGYYASLIGSSYYLAQFCSAFFWGSISDKYGRRNVLLIGILGGCITSLLFGFSKSLYWAIFTRVLFGLVNGNLGTHKVYISEITHKKHHPRVFSYISLSFSIGSIFGPIVGGFLSSPVTQYPALFNYTPKILTIMLKHFPFLLPNLFVSTIQFITFLFAYKYLKESKVHSTQQTKQQRNQQSGCNSGNANSFGMMELATPFICMMLYALIGFNNIVFAECSPLFMILSKSDGGLGFHQRDIGFNGSITGILMTVFQLLLCHRIMTRLGLLDSFKVSSVLLVFTVPIYPMLSKLANGSSMLWICLIALNFVRSACIQTSFAACNVMLNNSVVPQNRGKLNGIAQSMVSLARALAPLLGIIFALSVQFNTFPFNVYFTFFIMSSVHAISLLLASFLSREINEPKATITNNKLAPLEKNASGP